jgi:hypothetical protein
VLLICIGNGCYCTVVEADLREAKSTFTCLVIDSEQLLALVLCENADCRWNIYDLICIEVTNTDVA